MDVTGPWFCDACGELIENPKDGMVQWLSKDVDDRRVGRDLRIVHHFTKSPRGGKNRCYPDQQAELARDGSILSDFHLAEVLCPDGLVRFLMMLEDDELPVPLVNRIIMRLFVPGYEQAQRHFARALAEDVVEQRRPVGYFFQSELRAIIDEYVGGAPNDV